MLGRCPIRSSNEWQELLASNQGDEKRTLEEWYKLAYGEDDTLNYMGEDERIISFVDENIEAVDEEVPTFDTALQKIKVFLKEKQFELNRRKVNNQKAREQALKRISKQIKELEGVEAINAFVDHSFRDLVEVRNTLSKAMKEHADGKMSDKDLLDILVASNEFANGYDILDEITTEDINRFFSGSVNINKPISEYTPQDKIKVALDIRYRIKLLFDEKVIDLMAETLINYRTKRGKKDIQESIKALEDRLESRKTDTSISEKNRARDIGKLEKEIEIWKGMQLDKDSLSKILRETSKEESLWDAILSPLISSGDAPLSLFAKMVKNQFESTRIDDIQSRNEAVEKLKEFVEKTGRRTSNVADLNEGLYEKLTIVRRDVNGKAIRDPKTNEVIFDTVISYVQKYDLNKFEKARLDFYKDNPRPKLKEDATDIEKKQFDEALKAWYKKLNKWYADNTQAKSKEERTKIKDEKIKDLESGILTDEDYNDWLKTVEYTDKEGNVRYSRELAEPNNNYLNENWLKLYDREGNPISPEGEMHKFLIDKKLAADELLPPGKRTGYIVPSIEMDDAERIQRFGLKATAKNKFSESFQQKKYDQELFGEGAGQEEEIDNKVYGVGTPSGERLDIIPTQFTQRMDADDVSVDLLSTTLRYEAMARRYNALNEIQSEIYAFQKIIGNRTVAATDKQGNPIYNSFAKKMGYESYIKDNGISFSKIHVDEFINMVIKGESQKSSQWMNIELSKVTNSLMSISAITTIAADLLKGVANNLQGNIQLVIESAGSEYFGLKNYARAKVKYASKVGGCISDFGKPHPESWLGGLIEYYDAIQGKFKDEFGKDVTASLAQKLFRTNTLFWNQNIGEHEVQVTAMLALMDATQVIDKETGEEISLLAAHEKYGTFLFDVLTDENGNKYKSYKVEIRTNQTTENPDGELVDFDETQRIEHTNILHALNKRMHGVYNDFDKSVLQKYSAGRLLMMYRKYMVPSIKRRYKNATFDDELGGVTEGIYQTFWRTFARDLRTYKFKVASQWSTYSPFEKAQIRKVVAELTMIAALVAFVFALSALGGDDDDDKEGIKKTYAYNFLMYEAIRLRSETKQFLPFIGLPDWYRTIKSPSAVSGTIDRSIKFFDQFVLTWDPEKLEYQREQGVWDKGDNKSWAYFLKLMGFSGYNLSPEEAVKGFQSTFVR
jgi:hypothetical protein